MGFVINESEVTDNKMVTSKEDDEMSLMEAIPLETKLFLLTVTALAIIIFIVVFLMDSKPSCRCYDCESILPSSVVSYVKLRKKKYGSDQKGNDKQGRLTSSRRSATTGPGALSRPLGSSSSTPSSSEQDSDDDVIKSYRKSVALSRQSVCQVMMLSSGSLTQRIEKQDGRRDDDGRIEGARKCPNGGGMVDEGKMDGVEGGKNRKSDERIFGIFKKKGRKIEAEGMCFKNEVFSPLDEMSPTSISPPQLSTAKSFTDLSMTSLTADQSQPIISPLRTLWSKFNSRSTSKLNNDPISLHLTLTYFEDESQLEVNIIEAKDVPQWAVVTRVKITLHPSKKERFETKPKPGVCPSYDETTRFRVFPNEDVNRMVLKVRMYGGENRSLMLGWKFINFTRVLRTKSTQFWICLESEKADEGRVKSSSSIQSIISLSSGQKVMTTSRSEVKPELLVGLHYNDLTGFMKVHVVAGSQLVAAESFVQAADVKVYVKLSVMADKGQEMTHNRTTLKDLQRDSNAPFQETFAFQIPLCQLESVTLIVTAFKVRDRRKQMIGWFALGRSSSGEKETQHWNEMKVSKEEVTYWHLLLE